MNACSCPAANMTPERNETTPECYENDFYVNSCCLIFWGSTGQQVVTEVMQHLACRNVPTVRGSHDWLNAVVSHAMSW